MNKLVRYLEEHPLALPLCCAALLLPAYFINLGLLPLHSDEPTRAVVSMEMIFSGEYWVSTLGGAYYYNKPPLYNWLLAGIFHLGGGFSEFLVRLPAIVPLFLFAGSIYLVTRHYLGRQVAALAALFWMTNGRVLTYDSLFGHIDILYSWLTWLGFMAVIYFDEKKRYWTLFLLTYFITFLGFMLKGLPSFLFQGITLLVYYTYKKEFRRLFSLQHIGGFLFLLLLLTGYFLIYFRHNSLDNYLATLWDQSIRRTAVEKSIWESISFFLRFPFDTLLHMAPWGLLAVFCLRRAFLRQVLSNPFLKFNLLVLLGNILVYWLSPETRPKYIFMLYPCMLTLIAYGFTSFAQQAHFWRKTFDGLFIGLTFGMCLAACYLH
ncbi:MAG TPA: glycosyltransferase family 39 protein, partial [Anseongella sp.]|nr:glycosyltransferase family 39 protein [Anseongella sp.]